MLLYYNIIYSNLLYQKSLHNELTPTYIKRYRKNSVAIGNTVYRPLIIFNLNFINF